MVKQKSQYITDNGLAGAMFWELSGDKIGDESLVGTTATSFGALDQTPNHIKCALGFILFVMWELIWCFLADTRTASGITSATTWDRAPKDKLLHYLYTHFETSIPKMFKVPMHFVSRSITIVLAVIVGSFPHMEAGGYRSDGKH